VRAHLETRSTRASYRGAVDAVRHVNGSNAEEAQDGQTKPDFIAKLAVSRKESRETLYWLRLAIRSDVVTADEVKWELTEAGELRAMIVAAIKTAQRSGSRGP